MQRILIKQMDNKNKYEEFLEVRSQIKILEEREAALRKELLVDIKNNKNKVDFGQGTFGVGHRIKWTYSKKLQKQEELLNISKINEQENGKAKGETTEYMIYKERKVSS